MEVPEKEACRAEKNPQETYTIIHQYNELNAPPENEFNLLLKQPPL